MNTDIFDKLNIFDAFDRLKKDKPHKVVLSEGPKETELTVLQLDDISARVYRYLKERNIGKEDMVNIFLPRGCDVIVCLFGVWKAGAAATILEDDYPAERVDFIRKDCNCAFVIDRDIWTSILNTEPLDGHEPLDRHAAAFAVYTSGTTGHPKGVLHEYGQIAVCYLSTHWDGEPLYRGDDVFPLFFPLNFVPAVMIVPFMLVNGLKIMVTPKQIAKDLQTFRQYCIDHKVGSVYFPPSLYRSIKDWGPYLNRVYLCSEPANGIWSDPGKVRVLNGYASSETASSITFALLDKPNDIAPIGKPVPGMQVYLLDEDGREVPPGEVGEFCCEMPYTRGYINLPEENAQTFVDGVYHSGDLSRQDSDGNYYLIGRIKDTVSVNGKRVEPTEVEAAIRSVTGIDRIAVRGFSGKGNSYLCAYHLGDTDVDIYELKEKLQDRIPYYMIPSFFVKLESFPENANGKLDRMSLPEPSVMDYLTDYAPPSNDIEKAICEAMQEVLSVPWIGVNDNFFLLGGDSLLAMKMTVDLDIKGLSVEDVYAGKTPACIAKIYDKKKAFKSDDINALDKQCREIPIRLTKNQQEIFEYQQISPKNCMYNIPMMMRVEGIDAADLSRALKRVIENHPALLSVLSMDENGTVLQRYAPEGLEEIEVEAVTEKELMEMKDDLTRPFEMLEHPLFRCRVFSTPAASYFFLDIHHIVCDGFSTTIISNEIAKALAGEELEQDYYYYDLSVRMLEDEQMAEAKQYFESRYGGINWTKNLAYDFRRSDNPADIVELGLDLGSKDYETLKKTLGMGKNLLYITAGLLTLAIVSQTEDVMVSWVFNGRNTRDEMNMVGVLFYDLPVALRISDTLLMSDAIDDIRDQVEKGIAHSKYPYLRHQLTRVVEDDVICIMYQENIYDFSISSKYKAELIEIEENDRAAQNSFDIEIVDDKDGDYLLMDYSARFYSKETIENYGSLVIKIAKKIAGSHDLSHTTVKDFLAQL